MKIKTNKIQCKKCGDIIESKTRHDFVECSCGSVAVDGGKDYPKRSIPKGNPTDWYIDLSEYEEEENDRNTKRDI